MTLTRYGFERYALPSDDLAGTATSVIASGGSPNDADPEYPPELLIAPTNTGHYNLPSRPAKLSVNEGYWELIFASPIEIGAVHLVYPNFDEGLDVTLEPDGGTPIAITIPAKWDNGWWPSPFAEFAPQTSDTWRLSINEPNSLLLQIGRLLLYPALRDLGNDVRYGLVEDETYLDILQSTELGIDNLSELGGPRRGLSGEFALKNDTADAFVALNRSARGRLLPWTLVPDLAMNDAWFVRFDEPRWARTLEMIQHNIFPFRVRELSRGLPFP